MAEYCAKGLENQKNLEMLEQNPLFRVSLCVDNFKLGESYE